jgi:hypothetical protein
MIEFIFFIHTSLQMIYQLEFSSVQATLLTTKNPCRKAGAEIVVLQTMFSPPFREAV